MEFSRACVLFFSLVLQVRSCCNDIQSTPAFVSQYCTSLIKNLLRYNTIYTMMAAVAVAVAATVTRRRKRSMVFLLVVLWSGVTVVEAFTVTTLAGGNTAAAAAAASCITGSRCCLLSKAKADDADDGGVRTRIEETTPSPLSSLNRRAVFSKLGHEATSATAAVVTTTLLAPTVVTSAATGGGADDATTFERVIPQADFLAQIATGPVRTIVVTGANSGVGLAGAKFLVAAGHRVILACRTQAKADAVAHACYEYAENSAGDATTRREGGLAIGAECDLASLHSIRTFAQARIAEATASGNGIDTLVLNAGLAHGQVRRKRINNCVGRSEFYLECMYFNVVSCILL